MPKSYRIRTSVNQGQETDKEIRVQVDQDFDFLEILSLKLTQSEVYQRFCSDYGVIVGRVVANGGYGVPNARVSVFVPIDDIDLNNPVISTLYPYRAPSEKNEDGYRYNLLPYEPSYSGHSATGTFPSRNDVITRKEVLHIYEKYYKYTVRTNESGDYMIVGVPLGNQQIVMDLDLSDMGCFSLRPTDLIRMNVGIPEQFNGNEFKTSEDLDSLPQILNLRKTAFISPFWGVGDACDIGINRMDFDLREANIDIQPTSTFMGSIFTSSDTTFLKENCKPATEQGDLCGLTTGSGRILAVRQTIDRNSNGLPILEEFKLESGGKVIDDDGTFVVDVPMNLDYVVTDEFGQLVFSNDPKVGIPTKGKYRFKVKFNDSEKDLATTTFNPNSVLPTQVFNLSAFRPKGNLLRANYLIPNIKEYGWENGDPNTVENSQGTITEINFNNSEETEEIITTLPANTVGRIEVKSKEDFDNIQIYIDDVLDNSKWIEAQDRTQSAVLKIIVKKKTRKKVSGNSVVTEPIPVVLNFVRYNYSFVQFQKSYSFSLDWDDYPSIDDALNCNDTFYEFNYNKVYTTAQLIDEYRNGTARGRFLSIKEILERSCESEVNKFPINDGVRNFDLLYFIISTLFVLFSISLPILTIIYSVVKFLWNNFANVILGILVGLFGYLAIQEFSFAGFLAGAAGLTFGATLLLIGPTILKGLAYTGVLTAIVLLWRRVTKLKFPALKLPMILYPDCSTCDCGGIEIGIQAPNGDINSSTLADINTPSRYTEFIPINSIEGLDDDEQLLAIKKSLGWGQVVAGREDVDESNYGRTPYFNQTNEDYYWSYSQLPLPERINLYNTKAHYFNTESSGGTNRIKVYPNYTANTVNEFYEDMPYVFLMDEGLESIFKSGQLITSINPLNSNDPNTSGLTKNDLGYLGTVGTTPSDRTISITIPYANPENTNENIEKTFNIYNSYTGQTSYKFPADIEYYQVITGITVGELKTIVSNKTQGNKFNTSFYNRIITGQMNMHYLIKDANNDKRGGYTRDEGLPKVILDTFNNSDNLVVMFLMRGVDPYTDRQTTKIDISLPMGLEENSVIVEGNYKLNIPIKQNLKLPRHNTIINNQTNDLFFSSYVFTPKPISSFEEFKFTAFTSQYASYYSSLDSDNNKCGYGVDEGSGLRVKYNAGDADASCFRGYNTLVFDSTVDDSWNTRNGDGYILNEYVEGGSLMFRRDSNKSNEKWGNFDYVTEVYDTGSTITFNNNENIIMRSERLPRSDSFNYDYVFAQNKTFATYLVSDEGVSTQVVGNVSTAGDFSTGGDADLLESYGSGTTSVMATFSCQNIVPLGAYQQQNGQQLTLKPETDSVYYVGGDKDYKRIDGGCYVLCEKDLAFGADLENISEWRSRFLIGFAICRNVFGMTFTNQWVNGGLYLPGFQNDVIYPDGEVTNPTYEYCRDKIVFRTENNSFFYRSSPYNGSFVGMLADKQSSIFGTQQGNDYFLGSPTTIVDLGPKDEIIQNVCAQPQFQGYGMNSLTPTTFNSPGDLLQLFVISRLTNANFLERILGLGSASVGQFFSRDDGQKIDGDFAQLVSINSELGVTPFTPEGYSNSSLFYGQSTDPVIGVYFTANTQTRDFISPGRTTFIDTSTKFGYNTYGHKTQTVPMYKWSKQNANNFFGGENNNWKTDPPFYNIGYQNIDRLNDDTYFPSNIKNPTTQRPGYIYNSTPSSDSNGNITGFTYNAFDVPQGSNEFIVGAPFHFYFGLKKGRTAFDKFLKNNLIE